MNRSLFLLRTLALAVGLAPLGCGVTGVGDPCIPEDEYQKGFSGYGVTETNVESRSFQCETRICLVNHFQGRVSCPYGQDTAEATAAKPQRTYHIIHTWGVDGYDQAKAQAAMDRLVNEYTKAWHTPVKILQAQDVEPSLGSDSIASGIKAPCATPRPKPAVDAPAKLARTTRGKIGMTYPSLERRDPIQRFQDVRMIGRAGWRQFQVAARAQKKRDAQFRFQCLHHAADRSLRDA